MILVAVKTQLPSLPLYYLHVVSNLKEIKVNNILVQLIQDISRIFMLMLGYFCHKRRYNIPLMTNLCFFFWKLLTYMF